MSISQNQRLRKAAAKAAKRKAVVAQKLARERQDLSISKPRHIDFAASPIVACTMTTDYESRGMGTLSVARKLSLGRFGLCVFLLDTWCLGVKDAFFRVLDSDQYEHFAEDQEAAADAAAFDPGRARKLLRDAALYGASNGFPPPDDFAELERIFGDVKPTEEIFTFGDGGKPHYVPGPNQSRRHFLHTIDLLEQRFGRDGFQYTNPFEFFGDYDADEGDLLEGEAQDIEAISAPEAQTNAENADAPPD